MEVHMANLVSTRNAVAVGNGFIFADGGRADAGYKGKTGDCVVRAVAIAAGIDYKTAYKDLAAENAKLTGVKSCRRGIYRASYEAYLKRHGWVWYSAPKFDGRKAYASDFTEAEGYNGFIIARMAKHLAAVRDGVVYDTYDSSHKMVYGYFANLAI